MLSAKSAVFTTALALLTLGSLPMLSTAQTLSPTQKYSGNTENEGTVVFDNTFTGTHYEYIPVYIGAEDTLLTGAGTTPDPLRFDGYCINLDLDVGRPSATTLRSTDDFPLGRPGVAHGGSLAWLYNNYAASAASDNRQSAALQLSLWEAEYDWDGSAFVGGTNSSISLAGGNFSFGGTVAGAVVDADIRGRANAMLSAWSGKQDTATWFDNRTPGTQTKTQDLIGPRLGSNNVPEPGSLSLLAGVGGLMIAGLRRRRN